MIVLRFQQIRLNRLNRLDLLLLFDRFARKRD
jgi:hypothetical protein